MKNFKPQLIAVKSKQELLDLNEKNPEFLKLLISNNSKSKDLDSLSKFEIASEINKITKFSKFSYLSAKGETLVISKDITYDKDTCLEYAKIIFDGGSITVIDKSLSLRADEIDVKSSNKPLIRLLSSDGKNSSQSPKNGKAGSIGSKGRDSSNPTIGSRTPATEGGNGGNGTDGDLGENGGDGNDLSNSVIQIDKITDTSLAFKIICKSGDGGRGGNGGNGGKGGNGGNGGRHQINAIVDNMKAADGGNGGNGGNAGNAGDGGNAGNYLARSIVKMIIPEKYKSYVITECAPSSGSKPGKPGKGGGKGDKGLAGSNTPPKLVGHQELAANDGTDGVEGLSGLEGKEGSSTNECCSFVFQEKK